MKTKIIYISGNEVFEMADIRAAFDSVRATLGLDNDTVLFGVPVDADNAIETAHEIHTHENESIPETEIIDSEPEVNSSNIPEMVAAPMAETDVMIDASQPAVIDDEPVMIDKDDTPAETIEPTPVKKSRGRPRKITEPVVISDDNAPADHTPDTENKVIPILSVLAAKKPDADVTDIADEIDVPEQIIESDDMNIEIADADNDANDNDDAADDIVTDIDTETNDVNQTVVDDNAPTADTPTDNADFDIIKELDITQVAIDDMIADDVPASDAEKTLEQLLESMEPLREDIVPHTPTTIAPATAHRATKKTATTNDAAITDSDATLAQLAAEFAENQDKIVSAPAIAPHGKIGKLKNILPFKKVKRDDGGLMGDLFGWAGVAANDDDFAIPGFFTTAASKN